MIAIDEIKIPEIEKYYRVYIAVEEILNGSRTTIETSKHLIFLDSPTAWMCVRANEYPRNFETVVHEYSIYESEERRGHIIPVRRYLKFHAQINSVLDKATVLINKHRFSNPVILYKTSRNTPVFILEPSELRYLCFKVVPRKKWSKVERAEIEGFWEILAYIYSSDGRTVFEFKLLL